MKIREIDVFSLFGYFEHRIPLKSGSRITIIYGPNGVGKTTVLRLVHDLFRLRFHTLFATPFQSIVIRFYPNATLSVKKQKIKDTERSSPALLVTYNEGSAKHFEHTISPAKFTRDLERSFPLGMIEHSIRHLDRVGPMSWRDELTGDILSLDEIVMQYGDVLPAEIRDFVVPIPKEIKDVLKNININLVETQRLFTKTRGEEGSAYKRGENLPQQMTVEQYSNDMVAKIQQHQRESGVLVARLDSTFPQRLLNSDLPKKASEKSIRDLYKTQACYRDRLMKAGLIAAENPVSLPESALTGGERKVLWIYLNDVKEKLEVYDTLLRKVELFKDIVNSRFLYKKFEVDKEKGFVFISDHNESVVSPKALSSGEQHEIVLTYQLLFKAAAGSLIFIDEPELSLHVTWQQKFLEDIERISEMANLDFLVATHSPSIVNNRRDLMVSLSSDIEA